MRFWHIAHPAWSPDEPLLCRNILQERGMDIPWSWDDADDGTDCDRICLFPDSEDGREEAAWLLDDRPGYSVVRVDLPEDVELVRAEWEPYPAVLGEIPAKFLTRVDAIDCGEPAQPPR